MPFIHPACRAYTARTYGWDDIEVVIQPLCVPLVGSFLPARISMVITRRGCLLFCRKPRWLGLSAVRETQRTSYEDWCFSLR